MKHKGIWLFVAGALLAIVSVTLGNSLQTELRTLPVAQLIQSRGLNALWFMGFAFGFPLGIGISILGVMIHSGASARSVLIFSGVVLAASLMAGLVPGLWGRELSAGFFGTGGYLIMLLVLGLIWFWGRYRATVTQAVRSGVDLQGIGYLCFALAAWNLCGTATMPSFALEPQMMLSMGSQAFAVGQMKSIMVLFIFGWLSSLLGFWVILRGSRVKD